MDTIKKVKTQSTEWTHIFANHLKRLISRIYLPKNATIQQFKKPNNPLFKKQPKNPNRHFSKGIQMVRA
jgi:hypothetical protein